MLGRAKAKGLVDRPDRGSPFGRESITARRGGSGH
jgi:hypothetical protein